MTKNTPVMQNHTHLLLTTPCRPLLVVKEWYMNKVTMKLILCLRWGLKKAGATCRVAISNLKPKQTTKTSELYIAS
jgi:hypothetical protein